MVLFAAPVGTDESYRAPRPNNEIDTVQHRRLAVAEGNILELDLTLKIDPGGALVRLDRGRGQQLVERQQGLVSQNDSRCNFDDRCAYWLRIRRVTKNESKAPVVIDP